MTEPTKPLRLAILIKLSLLSSIIIFLLLIFNYSNIFKERFVNEPIKYYKDNHHKAHFLTAIEIFKNNNERK